MNPKAREIVETYFSKIHFHIESELPMEGQVSIGEIKKILADALKSYGEAMIGELPKDKKGSGRGAYYEIGWEEGLKKAKEKLTRFNAWS